MVFLMYLGGYRRWVPLVLKEVKLLLRSRLEK